MNEGVFEDRRDRGGSREFFLTREFFELVRSGTKTLELRVAFPSFLSFAVGDIVTIKSGRNEGIKVKITDIRYYKGLDDVLQAEDISKLAPGISFERLQRMRETLFREVEVKKLGLVVFVFEKVTESDPLL